jgi:hypothetical protein
LVVFARPEPNSLFIEGKSLVGPPAPAPQVSLGDQAGGIVGPGFVRNRSFELRRGARFLPVAQAGVAQGHVKACDARGRALGLVELGNTLLDQAALSVE